MSEAAAGRPQAPINNNTPVTIGLVVLILTVSAGAIFKAGQVLTEIDYLKVGIVEMRSDLSEVKRAVQRIDRKERSPERGDQ